MNGGLSSVSIRGCSFLGESSNNNYLK